MKNKKPSKYFYRYFSADTGRAVTKEFAEANPKTTVRKRYLRKVKAVASLLILASFLLLQSCAGIKFNSASLNTTYTVQQQTIALMDKATGDHELHVPAVEALDAAFAEAIANEERRGKTNYPTVKMWKQLETYVLVDFASTWEEQKRLSATAVDELKRRTVALFDYLIKFENSKIKKL